MVAAYGLRDEHMGFVEGQYYLVSSGTTVKISKNGCVVWGMLDTPVRAYVLQLQRETA